jgi:DNA-binding beta-propeller fold protein YncE
VVAVLVAVAVVVIVRLNGRGHDSGGAGSATGGGAAPYDITRPGLAISPDGRRLYVTVNRQASSSADRPAGKLVSIDTGTRNPTGTLDITTGAGDAVLTPDGEKLYSVNRYQASVALNYQLGPKPLGINGFDLPGGSIGTANRGIAIAPDGKHLYVADDSGNRLWSADITKGDSHPSIRTFPTTFAVRSVAVSPDGRFLYLAGGPPAAGARFDLGTGRQDASFPVGAGPRDMVVSRDGKHVYLASYGDNRIDVVDASTPRVARSFPGACGVHPQALAVNADGSRLYAACESSNVVSVIDPASGEPIGKPITVGPRPSSMVLSPDGRRLYVALIDGYDVKAAVIDTTANTVIDAAITVCPWFVS